MRNAGKTFHNEIGKYRFLNELIRVVSPKYLGPRCSTEVKNRVIEIMYSWTIGLKEQTKIADAYSMLKKQGIVKEWIRSDFFFCFFLISFGIFLVVKNFK